PQGQGNWEHIGKPRNEQAGAKPKTSTEAAASATTAESSVAQQPTRASTPLKLDINSLIINGARIDYLDEQSGQQFNLESVQLSTGAIRDNQPIALKFSGFL